MKKIYVKPEGIYCKAYEDGFEDGKHAILCRVCEECAGHDFCDRQGCRFLDKLKGDNDDE